MTCRWKGEGWVLSKQCDKAPNPRNLLRETGRSAEAQTVAKPLFLFFFRWEGKDETEIGRCKETGTVHVRVDPKFFRPTEVVSNIMITSTSTGVLTGTNRRGLNFWRRGRGERTSAAPRKTLQVDTVPT